MAFLGQEEQIREFQDRFKFLYAIVFIGLGLLTSRLVYLQILQGDKMREFSEQNRIKRVKIDAPRGMIFDRNRKLLIDNRPAFDLEIIPQYLHESHQSTQVIALLARVAQMSEKEIYGILDKNKYQPSFMPVKIKPDLTRDEVAEIESWKIEMPGVEVRDEIKRTNIYGDVASHLLGYIGEVNAVELPLVNKNGQKFHLGDSIGKYGLEQKLNDVLRGEDGEELKEVDALGRIKLDPSHGRVIDSLPDKPAVPGRNLVLTIDQDLQLAANTAFGDKIGSMVAIDPRSGEILAMLSKPSFDPTDFSRGIPAATWSKLLNNPNHPLRDKTIQDHYSPGSTFKILTAITGLEEGVIDEHSTFNCTGQLRVGNRVYHCWSKHGHGTINVVQAITQSCDVFFYHVALKLKSVDQIAKWATHMGLGRKTGILLSGEVGGLIPTEEWKEKRYHQQWNAGETASVAIGQSFVLVTALQMANTYAAIANGGILYKPFLVKSIEADDGKVLKEFHPEIVGDAKLHPKTVQLVKEGLWGVINGPHGTGRASRIPGVDFVGKTGTVQTFKQSADKIYQKCESFKFSERHNGVFVGFAPLNDPKIAVAVIGEHICHGTNAAPIARAVIKTYLEKYYPEQFGEKAIALRLKQDGKEMKMPHILLPGEEKPPAETASSAVADDPDHEDISIDTNDDAPVQVAPPPLPPALPAPGEGDVGANEEGD